MKWIISLNIVCIIASIIFFIINPTVIMGAWMGFLVLVNLSNAMLMVKTNT
jgi:hypothetical protein